MQRHMKPKFKSENQSVMAWGGFSAHERTQLVGVIGSFDQLIYRVVIDNYILPFFYDIHGGTDKFVLKEDNCGAHVAKSIATYLENEYIARMNWPAQSPDLNPIENV